MKATLLATLILMTGVITSAQAKAPHEKTVSDSIMHINMTGKINAAYLNAIDMEIFETKKKFEKEVNLLPETNDIMEGKIQAGMITLIESELNALVKQRSELEDDSEIIDADVQPIYDRLEYINAIIEDLNV